MRSALLISAVVAASILAGCTIPPPTPTPSSSASNPTPTPSTSPTPTTGTPAESQATFLLVRNHYWINETGTSSSNHHVYADFPHCVPATYTLDPDRVTIIHRGGTASPAPTHIGSVIVRDYRNRTHVPFALSGGPSTNDAHYSANASATYTLQSPFNHTRALATVHFEGAYIRINTTTLSEGSSTTLRQVYQESSGGKMYEITEQLTFLHRGPTPTTVRNEQPCI